MINRSVLNHDLKLILRDPLIIFFAVIPLILEVLFHTVRKLNLVSSLPFAIDPQTVEVLFRCLLPFFGGMIGGWMCGFMIMEEKEEEMDLLLRTVPLDEGKIFLTRLTLTLLISLSANTVLLTADSIFFGFNPYLMLIFAASASMGPFFMIILFRFGRNRVQGLTLTKLSSLILIPPILLLFLKEIPFWVFGVLSPLSWFTMAFRTALEGDILLRYPLTGLLYMGGICLFLSKIKFKALPEQP